MQLSFTQKKNVRKSFGKLAETLSIPNLIEVQKNSYKQLTDDTEHLALVKGTWNIEDSVSVRVHASSMISDVFQVSDLGKGPQLQSAMAQIEKEEKGVKRRLGADHEST